MRPFIPLLAAACMNFFAGGAASQPASVYEAILPEPDAKTEQVGTGELKRVLVDASAILVDTRPRAEFVAGHIPGAQGLDGPSSEYVAMIEHMVAGDKSKALVLYCNGPFCQASKRLAEQLVTGGFTNVRRYQLGLPIWRALGGPTAIELEGILRIFKADQTVVYFDARPPSEFAKGSLPGAAQHRGGGPQITWIAIRRLQPPHRAVRSRWHRREKACRCVRQEGLAQRLVLSRYVKIAVGRHQR